MLAPAGRLAAAWIGNAVAIGDAAAIVGPLDAAPLQLLHAQVERIVASLPDASLAAVEIADVNRRAAEEADRLRDFQIAHARSPAVPSELADTFARFSGAGAGGIAMASWRTGPTGCTSSTASACARASPTFPRAGRPSQPLRQALAALSQRLDAAVAGAPRHRDLLENGR
ncbi:tryptophan 7-halogenase [Sphingomonas sp. MMS24-JH45]